MHIRSRGNVDDVDEEMEIREMKKNVSILNTKKMKSKEMKRKKSKLDTLSDIVHILTPHYSNRSTTTAAAQNLLILREQER